MDASPDNDMIVQTTAAGQDCEIKEDIPNAKLMKKRMARPILMLQQQHCGGLISVS